MAQLADLVDELPSDVTTTEEKVDAKPSTTDAADSTKPGNSGDSRGTTDTQPGDSDKSSEGESDRGTTTDGAGEAESGSSDAGDGASETEASADEGYIADDGDEPIVEETAPTTPELQYIADNLPNISVRGRTTADGPIRTFNVKAAGQLPDEFQFANDREQALFIQAIAGQETQARLLQAKYQQDQATAQSKEFEAKQDAAVRHDIGELQRAGELPKFKYEPNDPRFNDDPAVKTSQEVMDYMVKHNQDEFAAGRTEFISYRTAYKLWKLEQPEDTTKTAQAKEDAERKTVTRRTAGNAGAPNESAPKPRVYGNMQDFIASLDAREL